MEFQFSDADAKLLRSEAAGGGAAAADAINFCGEWPAAKGVLQALAAVIPNPLAKAAISIVIAAGDAFCPGH